MCKYNDMAISVGRHQAIIIMRTLLNMHDLPGTTEVLQFLLITLLSFILPPRWPTLIYCLTKNVFFLIYLKI